MKIGLFVPSAEPKADGFVTVFIEILEYKDKELTDLHRELNKYSLIDQSHIVYNPSAQNIKIRIDGDTTLQMLKDFFPMLMINKVLGERNSPLAAKAEHSFAELGGMSFNQEQLAKQQSMAQKRPGSL